MPQAQTGKTKSVPKVVRVNAADGEAVLFRNLGNGRRLPFIWGTTVTLASGTTETVVSSGVSFNDHDVAAARLCAGQTGVGRRTHRQANCRSGHVADRRPLGFYGSAGLHRCDRCQD